MSVIHKTEFYAVSDPTFMCCDQSQFTYTCLAHQEPMGCQFCAFDPYAKCECV
jgi:hypothetical protein